MAKYWSLGLDGAPFGTRHLSKTHAEGAAAKTFAAYPDVTDLEILEVDVKVLRKISRLPDLFGGL